MFKKVTFTLLVYLVTIFAISSFVEAKAFDSVNRRDHESLNRLIKKRASSPTVALGVGSDPSAVTDSAEGADSTSSSHSSSSSSSTSQTSSTSKSSTSQSSSSSSSSSTTSSSSSSSASPTQTNSTTTSSSSSTTASSSSPSPANNAQTSEAFSATQAPVTSFISGTLVTLTQSVAASSTPNSNSSASVSGATSSSKTAGITVLIVVASCVGGIAILWTIFRKWKLGRSSKFDQRMQPINWQNPNPEDNALPTHRRRTSDTSSFHSGMHGGASDMGHGSSDHGHGTYGASDLPPLPTHDFTAGPTHLAPVGGYADLARGPSPQPQMQEATRHNLSYGATGGY